MCCFWFFEFGGGLRESAWAVICTYLEGRFPSDASFIAEDRGFAVLPSRYTEIILGLKHASTDNFRTFANITASTDFDLCQIVQ